MGRRFTVTGRQSSATLDGWPSRQPDSLAIIRRGFSGGVPIDQVCQQCHAPAGADHRFCGRCGAALRVICDSCQAVLTPGAAFCTSCGKPIGDRLAGGGTVSGGRAGATRQERRTVSVLFIDLVGFTGMAERLDPEDVRRLQLDYFATARAVIRRYDGLVEKYIGDAVMAVFGVPVETEHDASRAVLTGLALQQELDARPLAGRYQMRGRVGVSTGEVLVDLDAAHDGGQALLAGDAVAAASRLQRYAPPGGVLVSPATRRATTDVIRYDDTAVNVVLAERKPIRAWLATAPIERPAAEQDEATAFIGRQQELGVLSGVLGRCVRESEPQLVSVVGALGLGKSRLLRELRRRFQSTGDVPVRWCVGRSLPYGEASAYGALAEIVKSYAEILDSDLPEVARERLREALAALAPEPRVARLTDLLAPLVGLPGTPAAAVEAEAAWRDLLIAMARRQPTVIAVEDLHYADPGMLRFLAQLVDAADNTPLFLLCTYRPELLDDHPGWAAALPGAFTVSLGPLRGREFTSLVESLLARHDLPIELADQLTSITAGNPMYAVEYVRMLAERPLEDGRLDIDLETPDTVHGVLANRIDLLPWSERTVLHAAAVLGERVWPSAIAAAASLDPVEAATALRALCHRDMLVEFPTSSVAGEAEMGFRHQLLRDTAYRRLPRSARRELHSRAADWLARLTRGRHDLAAAVARHRVAGLRLAESLGEDTTTAARQARTALAEAAESAYAVHAVESALSHITEALALWPDGEQPGDRRAAELLRLRLGFALDADGFYRDGGPKELLRLAESMREHGETEREAQATALLGVTEAMRAERCKAAEHLTRAVALFADLPDSLASAEAHGELARLHMMEFEFDQAVDTVRVSWQIAGRLGAPDLEASGRITEAMARYLAGDSAAIGELERLLVECRQAQLPALRRATHNLAVVYTEEGDLTRAKQMEEEGDNFARGRRHRMPSHSEEALLAYFAGNWTTLLQAAEAYLDVEGAETTEWDLHLRAQRAWIRVLCGEPAGVDVDRCLDAAERSEFANLQLTATAHGALCHALQGDAETALHLLDRFLAVWRRAATTMTQEWLPAAAHAAAMVAPEHPVAADAVLTAAATAPRHTPWVVGSEQTARGAAALGEGDPAAAAAAFAEAVATYDTVDSASDAVLAAAWAARAWRAAGDDAAAAPYAERVRGFAQRSQATGLAALLD